VAAPGDRAGNRALQPQGADLPVEHPDVGRRDVGHRGGAGQHRPHHVQAESELAQRPDQVQPGGRLGVIEPVSGRRPAHRRHQPGIGPEPDRPCGHAGAPGQLPDGEQLGGGAHTDDCVPSSRWKLKGISGFHGVADSGAAAGDFAEASGAYVTKQHLRCP
jgi:hypothetical protein